MKIRRRKTRQTLLRSGLLTATAGAMLLSMTLPATAAELNTGATPFAAVGIHQPSTHPQGAQNVTVDVTGKQITVNWDRSPSHRGNYRVAVFQGSRTVFASYHYSGPVKIDPARVQTGVTYYVSVAPMDNWDVDIIQGSSALSDYFTLKEATEEEPPAPSPEEPGNSAEPGGGTEDGGEGSGGTGAETGDSATDTPAAEAPSAPYRLLSRLATNDSTAFELFWFEPEKGGPITGYEIELTGSDNSTKTLQADMQAELPEYIKITGLKPGVTYTAKVRAENKVGKGSWSEPSAPVTIPGNQSEFEMKIDEEGFGVFVHADHRTATVSWSPTGYEPAHAAFLLRILCVQDCGPKFKSFYEQFDAHGKLTSWRFDRLPVGVYKAQLKLADGNRFSKIIESEPFTIGVPLKEIKTELTVTPTSEIDPAVENTFKVSGTGYEGRAADKGVYVVVTDTSIWTPGKTPDTNRVKEFLVAAWVTPGEIKDGAFSTTITVPAGKFKPGKQYFVGTMAAHALSIAERDLDKQVNLTLKKETDPKESENPQNPGSETPGNENPSDGNTEQPPAETPAKVAVKDTASMKETNTFKQGEATSLTLTFTGVKDGSSWTAVLHSDPISLGTVTISGSRAVLNISAETAALFTVGKHTLKLTEVGVEKPRVIELPWTVVAKETTSEGGKPADPKTEGGKPADPKTEGGKPADPKTEGGKPADPKTDNSKLNDSNETTTNNGTAKEESDQGKADQEKAGQTQQKNDSDKADNSKANTAKDTDGKPNTIPTKQVGKLANTGATTAMLALLSLGILAAGIGAIRIRRQA